MRKKCKCANCGGEIEVDMPDEGEGTLFALLSAMAERTLCDVCDSELGRRQTEQDAGRKWAEWQRNVRQYARDTVGIPEGLIINEPWMRAAGEWTWANANANRHLLLTGDTGAGKTSSMCYAIVRLLNTQGAPKRIRYYANVVDLSAEYVAAKKNDAVAKFWAQIAALDIIAIDELGINQSISPSTSEMLFILIDGAYSGRWKTRVWLAGNIRANTLDKLFAEPETMRRRLKACFAGAWLKTDGTLQEIGQ